ncbi:uncharacterized protein LOC135201861 [Macrobrachium nipponense]|uniref:uncharacterized protein LOC135201861 n=1 Tax=Macrobrachium nipponense TaxID=159736 RepID=UPI0030C7FB9B
MLRGNAQVNVAVYRILCQLLTLVAIAQILVWILHNRTVMLSISVSSFSPSKTSHLLSQSANSSNALPVDLDVKSHSRFRQVFTDSLSVPTLVRSKIARPKMPASLTLNELSRKIHRKLFQYQEEPDEFDGQGIDYFSMPTMSMKPLYPAQLSNVPTNNIAPTALQNEPLFNTQSLSPEYPMYPTVTMGTHGNINDHLRPDEIYALVPLSRMNEFINNNQYFDDPLTRQPAAGPDTQFDLGANPIGPATNRLPFSSQFWENIEDLFLVLVRTALKTLTVVLRGLLFLLGTAGASRIADMALKSVLSPEDIVNIRGAGNTLDFIIHYIESSERLII